MGKKGEETRKAIKEKACTLFARKGYKNVTMKDICLETGLSRGGLYRHYESTQQVFLDIIEDFMSAQDNEFSEKMKDGYPATQILDVILERYRQEMLDRSASLSTAIYEFYNEHQSDSKENMHFKQYVYAVDMWKSFIEYGIQRGEFQNVNCEEIIDIIVFSYQGVRMFSTIMPVEEKTPQRVIDHIKRVLVIQKEGHNN